MKYTVHVGERETAWPEKVAEAPTRGHARRLAREHLGRAPAHHTKAEVRCNLALLDTLRRYPSGTIQIVHSARQRGQEGAAPLYVIVAAAAAPVLTGVVLYLLSAGRGSIRGDLTASIVAGATLAALWPLTLGLVTMALVYILLTREPGEEVPS